MIVCDYISCVVGIYQLCEMTACLSAISLHAAFVCCRSLGEHNSYMAFVVDISQQCEMSVCLSAETCWFHSCTAGPLRDQITYPHRKEEEPTDSELLGAYSAATVLWLSEHRFIVDSFRRDC